MYKLLICDDEELSREGLSEYVKSIRNDIEIIGYGRDGIEAISKIITDIYQGLKIKYTKGGK